MERAEHRGGVASGSSRWFICTTSMHRPSTSEARMNSARFSSLICPVRLSHCIAAIHSASVRETSRANACRCRTSAVMICASPRVVRGAPALHRQVGDGGVSGGVVQRHRCSPQVSSARSSAAACAIARILPSAEARGRYFIPQSGAITSCSRREYGVRPPDAVGDDVRRLDLRVDRSTTPRMIVLSVRSAARRGRGRTGRSRSRSGRPGSRPARAGTSSPPAARG